MTDIKKLKSSSARTCCASLSLSGCGILILAGLVGSFLLLWLAGGILIIADPLTRVDAVAVLSGGGPERMEEAARIYKEKNASVVILTDPGVIVPDTGTNTTTEYKAEAMELGIPVMSILETEPHANSTSGEAQELRRYLETHQINSCTVVTDPYHSFRTKLIFQKEFEGSPVQIAIRPVRDHWYRSPSWFLSRAGWEATITEYAKLAAFIVGIEGDQE